ncbi:MAG: hypothetical protein MK101_11025 [Phycisphaerales bacterium]|nr:hypothetical protein [Phycisphaerales bacterium]
MKQKLLLSVIALSAMALALLSLRQTRVVEVNRMNRTWRLLQHEQDAWQRLRLDIAAAARPQLLRPEDEEDAWSAAVDQRADTPQP